MLPTIFLKAMKELLILQALLSSLFRSSDRQIPKIHALQDLLHIIFMSGIHRIVSVVAVVVKLFIQKMKEL